MNINQKGLDLIKSFEGLKLNSYKDAVGVWTIGYGHTSMAGQPAVVPGMTLTKEEAEKLLLKDLLKYEQIVKNLIKVELNDNQYSALVSFVYNLGGGNFEKSTLLKKINNKDFDGAVKEFAKWNKAGGKVLKGLTRRRAEEASLFRMPLEVTQKPVDEPKPIPAPQVPEIPKAPVEGSTPSETPKSVEQPPVASTKPMGIWDAITAIVKALFGGK